MNEIKLKPCPFCGEAPTTAVINGIENYPQFLISCPNCNVKRIVNLDEFAPFDTASYTIDKAVDLWNNRTVRVNHGTWLHNYDENGDFITLCSVCGKPDALSRDDYSCRGGKIRDNDSNYCPNCGAKMDGGD